MSHDMIALSSPSDVIVELFVFFLFSAIVESPATLRSSWVGLTSAAAVAAATALHEESRLTAALLRAACRD